VGLDGRLKMGITKNIIKRNFFRDSVQLMILSDQLKKEPGVIDAAIVMGTEVNKNILLRSGLLTTDGNRAGEMDTIISLSCDDESSLNLVNTKAEQFLSSESGIGTPEFANVDSALKSFNLANLAMISIPGRYVKDIALELLNKKLHIFLFSDHVSLEDEIQLKKLASKNHLLLMGPEAGTSIINGIVLGFGNRVRAGNVGIIGASGTGIQESSTLLDMYGSGISHAIGVGGRDMHQEIGGLMTLQAIEALENDPKTKLVLLVSKPVDNSARNIIVNTIKNNAKKKYVLCLIGDEDFVDSDQIVFAKSIQSSVLKALKLSDPKAYKNTHVRFSKELYDAIILTKELSNRLSGRQRYIRGFFAGGTMCYESTVILEQMMGREKIYSNLAPANSKLHLNGTQKSIEHTCIDFGNLEFTAARPHPMIDPSLRITRILEEAKDPNIAVIIIDIITGYSVASNTVQLHANSIKEAISIAGRQENGTLSVFVYICGTDKDVPASEIDILKASGAQVFRSNALMSFTAGFLVKQIEDYEQLKKITTNYLGEGLEWPR
jgi:succinyl-CoA synthetase alpha subunit